MGSFAGAYSQIGGKPDYDKARALLAESGYKGEKVIVLQPRESQTTNVALLTAQNLGKIGVNVELQAMDWSTLTQRRASMNEPEKGGWSIIHTGWEGATINPLDYPLISGACEKAWYGWPCDPETDRLRSSWVHEPDPAKQKQILDQLHSHLVEEVPFVPLGQRVIAMAWRKTVHDVIAAPVLVMWNITKD